MGHLDVGAAIAIIVLFGYFIAFFAIFIYTYITNKRAKKKSLDTARTVLQEGNLPLALEGFKQSCLFSLGVRSKTSDLASASDDLVQALKGISEVYQRAGKEVDLCPLMELKKDYSDVFKHYWKDLYLTKEGEDILNQILKKINEFMASLPPV